MTASVTSPIDGVSYGTPMTSASDPDESLGYTEAERAENMRQALLAYRGRLAKPLIKKAKTPNLNLRNNRCRTIVDTGVAFLFGSEVKWAVDESAGQPAQDDLDTCWTANKKALALESVATNGGIFGHVFVKVLEDGVIRNGQKFPRIVVLDPQTVTVETDPDDCLLPIAFNICWMGVDATGKSVQRRQRIYRTDLPHVGQDVGYDEEGVAVGAPEAWSIQNQVRQGTGTGGQSVWANVGPEIVWPYDWCPIHACSNLPEPNTYYGAPDLTPDIIELQKALNFALSNRNTILYHHAHPKTWGKGFQASEYDSSPDGVTIIASETGMLANLEMSGGLAELNSHIDDIRTDMDELSGVPGVATGRIKDMLKGAVPGITIRMEFQPLITKTEKKQYTYGDMLCELNSHLLEMMGHGQCVEVTNLWQDPLPVNMAEWATWAPVANQMGISKQTLLSQAGYDWDQEQQRKQVEDQADADVAQQAMSNFDAGKTPGAAVYPSQPDQSTGAGNMMPGQDASQPGPTPPSPAVAVAALNHPAMQAQRAAAIATAGKKPSLGGA